MAEQSVKTGSCRCAAVKFEVAADPMMMYLCHCNNCKKSTGSAFTAQIWFPRTSVKVTGGQDKMTEYTGGEETKEGQDPKAVSSFCGTCHSFLWVKIAFLKDILIVASGTMDDTSFFKPQKEFFVKRRCGWINEIEGASQHNELN